MGAYVHGAASASAHPSRSSSELETAVSGNGSVPLTLYNTRRPALPPCRIHVLLLS